MKPRSWTKQPFDERTLEFDVTNALGSGDSVSSVDSVTVYYGDESQTEMVSGSPSVTGNKVYAKIIGGTAGLDYVVRVRVETTNGDKIEDELNLLVRNT